MAFKFVTKNEKIENTNKEEKLKWEDFNYIAPDDSNQLKGGKRDKINVYSSMRSPPMFFRYDGGDVDIVDLYKGKSIFIISNGPSFNEVEWDLLKKPGIITYGLNNGANFFRPNFWTSVDNPYKFIDNIYLDPSITKFVPQAHFEKKIWNFKNKKPYENLYVKDCPNVIGFRRNERFNPETFFYEETINWGNHASLGGGRSVLIAMIRICQLLGFRKIYLLGCDFDYNSENPYFFKEKRTIKNQNHQNKVFKKKNDFYFTELLPYIEKISLEIINLNKNSKLNVFPFMDWREAIEKETIETYEDIWGYDELTIPHTKGN